MSFLNDNTISAEMQAIFQENAAEIAQRVTIKDKTADHYKIIHTENTFRNFKDCGHLIGFDEQGNIVQANFCKHRFCTVCNKRNSSRKWHYIKEIAEVINKTVNPQWLFLTTTIKNTSAEDLKQSINHLMESINRMFSTKTWKKRVLGFFRSLEITFNAENNTYHPHYHILIAVPHDYYTNENIYMNAYEWRKLWEKSARLEYNSQVKIEGVQSGDNLSNAIAEVAKYAVKMSAIMEQDEKALKPVADAVRGRRLISYGGIIKEQYKVEKSKDLTADEIRNRTVYFYNYVPELEQYMPDFVSGPMTENLYKHETVNKIDDS